MSIKVIAHWGDRAEGTVEIAGRLATLLASLSEISALLGGWRETARTRSIATPPIDVSGGELVHIVERGRSRRDADSTVIQGLGSTVALWSTDADDAGLTASMGICAGNPNLANAVVLSMSDGFAVREGIVLPDRVGALVAAFVQALEPHSVGIVPGRMWRAPEPLPRGVVIGWTTYLRVQPASMPFGVSHEPCVAGTLFRATETIDEVTEESLSALWRELSRAGVLRAAE